VNDQRGPPDVLLLTDAAPAQRPILTFLRELGCRVDVTDIGAIAAALAFDEGYHLVVIRRLGPPGDLPAVLSRVTSMPERRCAVFLCTNLPPPPVELDAFFPEPLDMGRFREATFALFRRLRLRVIRPVRNR